MKQVNNYNTLHTGKTKHLKQNIQNKKIHTYVMGHDYFCTFFRTSIKLTCTLNVNVQLNYIHIFAFN